MNINIEEEYNNDINEYFVKKGWKETKKFGKKGFNMGKKFGKIGLKATKNYLTNNKSKKLKKKKKKINNRYNELYKKYLIQEELIQDLEDTINTKNKIINNANNLNNSLQTKYNNENDENEKLKDYIQKYNIEINPESKDFYQNFDIELFTSDTPKTYINGKPFYSCQLDSNGEEYENCINDFNVINNNIPSKYNNDNPPHINNLYTKDFDDKINNKIVSPICPTDYELTNFSDGDKTFILCNNKTDSTIQCIPYDTQKMISDSDYKYLTEKNNFSNCSYEDDSKNTYMIKNISNSRVFTDDLDCKKWCLDNPKCIAISITKDGDNNYKCNLYKSIKDLNPISESNLYELSLSHSYLKKNDNYVYNLTKDELDKYYNVLKYGECIDKSTTDFTDYCKDFGDSYDVDDSKTIKCPSKYYGENQIRYQCKKDFSKDTYFDTPPINEPFQNKNNYYILILLLLIFVIILLKIKKWI